MNKGDRALQLKEQGLDSSQIAERLGCNSSNVYAMIANAKRNREKQEKKCQTTSLNS